MRREADVVLVLGSQNSSNSQRLAELAAETGVPAYLIDGAGATSTRAGSTVDETVLITAGASAPEVVVQECVEFLEEQFGATVEARTRPRGRSVLSAAERIPRADQPVTK